MNEEQQLNQILEALKPLADKLQVAGEHIWELAIRQVYVTVVIEVLVLLVLSGLAIPLYKILTWGRTKSEESSYSNFDNNEVAFAGIIFILIIYGIVFATVLTGAIIDIPQAIINPEWVAVKNIMSLIPSNN